MVLKRSFMAVAFAISLLCSIVDAQVSAKITGPTQARVGDLVVLSGRDSVCDNHKWVEPQRIQTLLCGDGKDLAFATGTPGTYVFALIVADKNADIAYVQHSVVVSGAAIDPPPVDPGDPTPPPPAMEELIEVSRLAAASLNDKTTAAALATAIRDMATSIEARCSSGTCPGLDESKRLMVATIEATLLRRKNDLPWANAWRVPVNAKLKQINAVDVPTYVTAMRAVALGLSKVP